MSRPDLPDPSRLWRHMQDTHGISLLVSEEADIVNAVNEDHHDALEAALAERDNLEAKLDAWRQVAGQLHTALAASTPGQFPGPGDSAIRCAALEAYTRLKTGFNAHEL